MLGGGGGGAGKGQYYGSSAFVSMLDDCVTVRAERKLRPKA